MNVHGGMALIRSTWLSWMQHRSFFFLLAFGWMIPPLIYLFVWSTAAGGETIGGLTQDEFIAYYILLIVVNQLTYSQTNWTVGDEIRYGGMNAWLLRPMWPVFQTLSTEFAGKVVYLTFTIPAAILLGFIFRPQVSLAAQNLLLCLPALLMAWALRFFWGYWIALLAFWATRADALLALQDSFIFLLGGLVAPIRLLPDGMRALATLLPFRYMVAFPVEVLTGQLPPNEIAYGFLIQAGWLLVALSLYALLWRKGLKHYMAVGG
jgi:ABC-2 type transport system permease protein